MNVDTVVDLSAGNPGAIRVLYELAEANNMAGVLRLKDVGIRGPGIWILYKARCDCDLSKLRDLLAVASDEELKQKAQGC